MLVAMVSTGVHNATPVSLLNVNPTFGCSRIRYVNPLSSEALNLILAVLLTSTCITSSPSINGGSFSTIKKQPHKNSYNDACFTKKNQNYEMRFTMTYIYNTDVNEIFSVGGIGISRRESKLFISCC